MNDEVCKYIWRHDTCSVQLIRLIHLSYKAENSLKKFEIVNSVIPSLNALHSSVLMERELGTGENFVHTWFDLEEPQLTERHVAGEHLN